MADSDNLELKKRARRRLVGAAALALLAALILPMVMDQEPAPTGQDVQIVIPTQDAEGNLRMIAGSAGQSAQVEPMTNPPSEPSDAVETPPVPAAPLVVPPKAESPSTPKPPAKPPEPKPEHKPIERDKPADRVPEPSERTLSSEAARAQAILQGHIPPAPTHPASAPSSGAFVVQIGAFRDSNTASTQRERLKIAGFNAYTEKIGDATRVRVGPFSSREAAEAERIKLEMSGFKGVVTSR